MSHSVGKELQILLFDKDLMARREKELPKNTEKYKFNHFLHYSSFSANRDSQIVNLEKCKIINQQGNIIKTTNFWLIGMSNIKTSKPVNLMKQISERMWSNSTVLRCSWE